MCPRSKTFPLAHIHLFTRQIGPSLYQQSSTRGCLQSIIPPLHTYPINSFLPSITFLRTCRSFFSFFHFHRIPFHGLAGACINPGSFSSNFLHPGCFCLGNKYIYYGKYVCKHLAICLECYRLCTCNNFNRSCAELSPLSFPRPC